MSFYAESLQPNIWDPASNTFTATAATTYAIFCGGHTTLADGRIFIVGGHAADYVGYTHALIYDPGSNTFTALPEMTQARWYPTATTLPNGDVLVVSGDINSNTNVNPLPQVFQLATNTWRDLTSAQLAQPLYPNMFVAPNGSVFSGGPSRQSRYLNTDGTGAWSNVAVTNFAQARDYGPVVMYDTGKVLAVGGGDPPTPTAELIDLNAATPAWKFTGSMNFPRRQHNAVILPDGTVFIVGGSNAAGFDTSTSPVLPTEMWDPATGKFSAMANIAVYRGYHAIALLLPDGRVLSAGGNMGGPNAQLFSPPYLFAGARPTIASTPSSVSYGQTIFVATPDAAAVTQVTLLRAGSVTHTNDMSQRFLRLSFTQTSTGLNVTMPANGNLAPPGYYLLFLLNSAGVPSVGTMIQVSSMAANTGTLTGAVTNTAGASVAGASVSSGGNAAVTGADGSYSLQLPSGSEAITAALAGYQSASVTLTVDTGASTKAPPLQISPINPGSASGTVVAVGGTGLAGATVIAGGLGIFTANDGTYNLSNLPAGNTTVTATLTGYQSSTATLNVVAGTSTPAPAITLVSSSGMITGTVKSAAGTAIAGASVGFGGGSTTTDATGAYTLAGIPVGTVQLVASAAGFQSVTQSVTMSGGASTAANFTLSPATGTVMGAVKNISNGAVIPAATVSWSGGSTTANTSGVYTLSNVAAGTQNVTAVATGYLPRTSAIAVSRGIITTLNFQLATAGKVTVQITGANGVMVSGASVTIQGGVIPTTVAGSGNTSGVFATNWIPVGSYTITVAKTGHVTQTRTATVSSGVTITVTCTGF